MIFGSHNKTCTTIAATFSAGIFVICQTHAATIDGSSNGDGYTTTHIQTIAANSNVNAVLANFRHLQDGNLLNVFIGSRLNQFSIFLFIDSRPGGVSKITSDLIQIVNEEDDTIERYMNDLGSSETTGMTFENGFLPDMAIRIAGSGLGGSSSAPVNRYDLVTRTFTSPGNAATANLSDGPISEMKVSWASLVSGTSAYATHSSGVEIALDLSSLGVTGETQTVKMMAIVVEGPSVAGTNQVLGSLPNNTPFAINSADFQAIAGTQTLSIPVVIGSLDSDGDGLNDTVETNDGVFQNATHTGTDPGNPDTDGDGYLDGAEVSGTTALGYISNPNIRNDSGLEIFNLPTPSGSIPSTAMTRASSTLAGQYQWSLDYKFVRSQIPPESPQISYKFKTTGLPLSFWGSGPTPGLAVLAGNDIPAAVPATGMHRFSFDQATLEHTFARRIFSTPELFLAAYGLTAGSDSDGDGIPNENEFTANTDPTTADSDGDGLGDSVDELPLFYYIPVVSYSSWISDYSVSLTGRDDDPDGDGFTNRQEFHFGTSPATATGPLAKLSNDGNNLVLRWNQRTAGVTYLLQQGSSLDPGSWTTSMALPTNDPDQSGLPPNCVRRRAVIAQDIEVKFLRVRSSE